MRIDKKSLKKT